MRRLLNTLFVLSEDSYLSLDGENVVVMVESIQKGRFPLHTLEAILYFGYKGASPSLMGACAQRNIGLTFLTPNGRFLARVCGTSHGNVLLRKQQYRLSDQNDTSCLIARNIILGKVYNCRWVLERATRDHPLRVDVDRIKQATMMMHNLLPVISQCTDLEQLRGYEGEAAKLYFGVINELVLQNKEHFAFTERTRRPPQDRINALLSFIYTVLSHDCASALEGVGLDSYVGFLHRDRPGRSSLALDVLEELRGIYADRFCLTLINNRELNEKHFIIRENKSVYLSDDGRKIALTAWQNKKRDEIRHPFLDEKIPWGLVPHVQALLLARYIRGDLDTYPPFLWK